MTGTPADPAAAPPIRLDVWADLTCPWCHIGHARLRTALARLPRPEAVAVHYRAFELDPHLPAGVGGQKLAALAARKSISLEQAREMYRRIGVVAAAEPVDFAPDSVIAANTFDAHRLIKLAADRGARQADAVVTALHQAHFADGRAIDDRQVLADIGADAGLDRAAVHTDLGGSAAGDAAGAAVRADEQQAAAMGVGGVPFYLADGRLALSGAQAPGALLELLRAAADGR